MIRHDLDTLTKEIAYMEESRIKESWYVPMNIGKYTKASNAESYYP